MRSVLHISPRLTRALLFYCGAYFLFFAPSLVAEDIHSLDLGPIPDMTRAELYYFKSTPHPTAVLVLCPGYNGNGSGMIRQAAWQNFAKQHNLGLIGIHFESPVELLSQCQGYYQASKGSGAALLSGIRQAFGPDLPIMIYGFSGGAHFTTRFVTWRPDRVIGWCALGAGVLDPPETSNFNPPGIIACGETDPRLGGALTFFKQGRTVRKPWLWIEVPNSGHVMSSALDDFIRDYFASVLHSSAITDMWVDIDTMQEISEAEAVRRPALSGWLPDRKLFKSWERFRSN